jgi:arylsulfatase
MIGMWYLEAGKYDVLPIDSRGALRFADERPQVAVGRKGAPASIKLFVDGKPVGAGALPVTIPLTLGLSAGVSIGANVGSPVMTDYTPPFAFTGTIKKALVDLTGEPLEDKETAIQGYLKVAMARQ